jgi:hypothetical protein
MKLVSPSVVTSTNPQKGHYGRFAARRSVDRAEVHIIYYPVSKWMR